MVVATVVVATVVVATVVVSTVVVATVVVATVVVATVVVATVQRPRTTLSSHPSQCKPYAETVSVAAVAGVKKPYVLLKKFRDSRKNSILIL